MQSVIYQNNNARRNTPVNEGGIGQVVYTLVADVKHDICQAYDVERPDAGVAVYLAENSDKL